MEYVGYTLTALIIIIAVLTFMIRKSEHWDTFWFWHDWSFGCGYGPYENYALYWGISIGPLDIRKENPAVKKYQHHI